MCTQCAQCVPSVHSVHSVHTWFEVCTFCTEVSKFIKKIEHTCTKRWSQGSLLSLKTSLVFISCDYSRRRCMHSPTMKETQNSAQILKCNMEHLVCTVCTL